MSGIREWVVVCHELARSKGWWPQIGRAAIISSIPEKLALIHSEISEALEEYRNGTAYVYEGDNGKPEGLAVELADAVIRIFDLAGALEIDLEEAIRAKHRYNATRPQRHGGKRA